MNTFAPGFVGSLTGEGGQETHCDTQCGTGRAAVHSKAADGPTPQVEVEEIVEVDSDPYTDPDPAPPPQVAAQCTAQSRPAIPGRASNDAPWSASRSSRTK